MLKNDLIDILRWIAVLPAAFAAAIAANLLGSLLAMLVVNGNPDGAIVTDSQGHDLLAPIIAQCVTQVLTGVAFVTFGVKTAPKHNGVTAWVLTAVVIALVIVAFFAFARLGLKPEYSSLLNVAATMGGAVGAAIKIAKSAESSSSA